MSHYTCTYTVLATNLSTAALGADFAAIPRDTSIETLLGIAGPSDLTTMPGGNLVQRQIIYSDAAVTAANPIPTGAPLQNVLQDYLVAVFSRALNTPVQASAVTIGP